MKRLFGLVCLLMLAIAASAQITWNAKGGIGAATCYGDFEGLKSHFVGKIGIGIEKPLNANWSLMPSLEFAVKGTKDEADNYNDYGYGFKTIDMDLYYLQIPIMAAYRINLSDQWNTTLKVGPYFAYQIANGGVAEGRDGKDSFGKKFDTGLDVGVDFERGRFVFGGEIEWGVTPIVENEYGKIKNLAFYATVGWKF